MPHNYTLVVKAKDCLFRFEFDFCDFCREARQAFGVIGHPYQGWKVPRPQMILWLARMTSWPSQSLSNYGGNSDDNEIEFTNKLHRMPVETPLFCCFLDKPVGQIRQYFAHTSKYFSQSCKRTILQKTLQTRKYLSRPGKTSHSLAELGS